MISVVTSVSLSYTLLPPSASTPAEESNLKRFQIVCQARQNKGRFPGSLPTLNLAHPAAQ